ncbi:amino acid permease 8-like [Pistacia vera]|uniref:amino acid permease 8-like n=1 Tax=Pistacia vera TaxID=55513 RepID=UPI001262DE9E|nr:amino acid permease 8-like [Pistacia vera]
MAKIVQHIQEEISCESSMDISKVADREIDDDGRYKRTGTVWTASSHIITAIVGSGVLSLAWGIAQLGWITGVATLLIFSAISLYTAGLLADCYRAPDSGKRNYSYGEAVKCYLGGNKYKVCELVQFILLTGMLVGYTITTSISMEAIRRSNCFHKEGHGAPCKLSNNQYMIAIGIVEILLSQIPNFHKLSWLSTVAAIMSFSYSGIGMGLAFVKIVSGQAEKTTLTGVEIGLDLTAAEKIWRMFRALGDMTFACAYSPILIEIQNTLRSSPPANKVMKKANVIATFTATTLNMVCGCLGYAALGNHQPGNMLTGFGFYEPFWLIDLANFFIVVHLMGAYQVVAQPVFSSVESRASMMWPNSKFIGHEYPLNISKIKSMFSVNLFRLSWRTIFVVMATVISMALPFFNEVLALLGAIGYWPLTVYFPVEMYIVRKNFKRGSIKWLSLQLLNVVCLLAAMAALCGSIQGLNQAVHTYKPFKFH